MYCPLRQEILPCTELELSEVIVELHPHKVLVPEWMKGKKYVIRKGWGAIRSIIRRSEDERTG